MLYTYRDELMSLPGVAACSKTLVDRVSSDSIVPAGGKRFSSWAY
jgi:hypothetical protein